MSRSNPSRRRALRALIIPCLFSLGFSVQSCSSDKDEPGDGTIGGNVSKLVYIVRQNTVIGADGQVQVNVAGGMGQVMDYLRYMRGGHVDILNLSSGDVQNVTSAFPDADISSLDINYDGTKVVFSMKQNESDSYHLYWTSTVADAGGQFEIHQLTFGDSDDVYPVALAGDKIAFVTNEGYTEMGTRADEYNHGRIVSQIATVTLGGGDADRKLCSQNLSHTINLFALANGKVGFSRWEHLENINDVKLFAMNPDCSQMVAISGQHGKPGNSLVQVSESNTANVFYAITTDRENTIQSGSLIKIDARNPDDPNVFYEEEPEYTLLTPAVPRGMEPSPVGRYRYPVSLPNGQILVSWANGFVNEINELSQTPPDFGIYIYDPGTKTNKLVKNNEGTWEVFAKPIVARNEPPILSGIQNNVDATTPMQLGSIDVKQTSLTSLHGESVSGAQFAEGTSMDDALAQAVKVRIIEGFSSEAAQGVTMFGLTMAEGAAMIGEAPVETDGSWLAKVPPYVPMHLQPIDEYDLAIRNQTTWIQGMPGEDRVCGGCHEKRKDAIAPGGQSQTIAMGKGAVDLNNPINQRTELPWYNADAGFEANEVQAVLTAKCASCHNAGTTEYYTITMTNETLGTTEQYQIPRLDLSSTPITVTYDGETAEYAASYVSIFYPAALEMEMDDATITGTIPPKWGIPSDARGSALIEKINIESSKDPSKNAWTLGTAYTDPNIAGSGHTMHPEDVGGTLTREERIMLIRAIDMGGQYYARQNTGFQPYAYGSGGY